MLPGRRADDQRWTRATCSVNVKPTGVSIIVTAPDSMRDRFDVVARLNPCPEAWVFDQFCVRSQARQRVDLLAVEPSVEQEFR